LAFLFNPYNLSKLENFLKDLNWQVRYEKGNFQSGSCIVRERKIVVINKFVPLEQKIQALIGVIHSLSINTDELSSQNLAILKEMKKIEAS
jgi:hypothetical protein